jgi:hypothetical protein
VEIVKLCLMVKKDKDPRPYTTLSKLFVGSSGKVINTNRESYEGRKE